MLKNRLNGCQIFGRFGDGSVFKTESEPNFGFPHIPTIYHAIEVGNISDRAGGQHKYHAVKQ